MKTIHKHHPKLQINSHSQRIKKRAILIDFRQGQNKTSDSLSGNSHNNASNNDAYNAEIF
tara:strand:- start:3686 stop:3865 length:180 start_codon:yes stop_codon:yes gene_type:complete